MTRREFLSTSAALSAGSLLPGRALAKAAAKQAKKRGKQPNILWVLTDGQPWYTVHACGKLPWLRTPELDKLAARGTLFRQAFCQAP